MQVKKEISVAVFIGLIIGAIIIGGIYRAKSALDAHLESNLAKVASNAATINPNSKDQPNTIPLSLESPIDNTVIKTAQTQLSGTTQKDTYITILTEKNEYIIVPDDTGKFSQPITLIKGANAITITVYTPQGDKVEKIVNVVYTTAEL